MLALHGFDAYGLEISQTAVTEADKYASAELKEPTGYNFGSTGSPQEKPGTVKFVEGDFFSGDWEKKWCNGEKFDLIYDYTVSFFLICICFCNLIISVPMCPPSFQAA